MTLKHLVFVYGTLKTGEPNHPVISTTGNAGGQSQLVGPGRTVDTFPLVIASRYNIPYLLDAPEQGQRVRGEVFSEKQLGRQFSIDAVFFGLVFVTGIWVKDFKIWGKITSSTSIPNPKFSAWVMSDVQSHV